MRVIFSFSRFVQQLQRLVTDQVFAVHYERVLLADGFSYFVGFFIAGVSLCDGWFIFLAFVGLNLCAESADISGVSVVIGHRVITAQRAVRRFRAPRVQLEPVG